MTRFYLPSNSNSENPAPVTPSISDYWGAFAPVVGFRELESTPSGLAPTHDEMPTTLNAMPRKPTVVYVSATLPAQTITGTLTIAQQARKWLSGGAARLHARVRVVSTDGTATRGVLWAGNIGADLTYAYTPGYAHRIVDAPVAPVTVSAGDRLVVEFGFAITTTSSSTGHHFGGTRGADMEIGGPVGSNLRPWVELSADVFNPPSPEPPGPPPPPPAPRLQILPPAKALLRVGGEWVHTHAHYGDLEVTDRADGGCWSLSWSMNLPAGEHMPWLAPNSRVELYAGSLRWSGTLADPDWDGGRFTADGLCRQAESTAAIDLSGATNNIDDALYWALIGRNAITFNSLETFGSLPDAAREINSLSALLDQWGLENSRRWGVNEWGWLRTTVDPTAPSLWVLPGVVDLSASTATQATHVIGEYLTSGLVRVRAGVGAGDRTHERLISLEDLGPISAARAQTIVDEIYRRAGGGKPIFTTGFEVAPGQVVDAFGPVDLSLIRPGRMIRIHGCDDPRTGAPYTDLVIGETVWRPQEGRVQVNPIDLDAADFESIVEELGGSVVF